MYKTLAKYKGDFSRLTDLARMTFECSSLREARAVLEALASPERDVPDYVEVDVKKMTAQLLRGPKLEDVPYPVSMEPNLVVEFYSR